MRRGPTHKDWQEEDHKAEDHEYREPGDDGVKETKTQELIFFLIFWICVDLP